MKSNSAEKVKLKSFDDLFGTGEAETGETAGDSGRTVQRYIRLSELVQDLLDYVDENKIPLAAGEKLSYLNKEEQGCGCCWQQRHISFQGAGRRFQRNE